MKELSVIVPIYNVEQYLRQCLESLVEQDDLNMEVLCINDGSLDHSQEIVDEFVRKYPDLFVSYIKENGGLGDARNYGVKKATGDYLLFMDSDDFYEKNSLKNLINFAKENQSDCVVFDYVWYDEIKNEKRCSIPRDLTSLTKKNYPLVNPSACAKLIKRECFLKGQFTFPSTWYEDLATTPAYVLSCERFSYYPFAIYYYRQRNNSITHQSQFNPRCLEMIDVLARLAGLLNDEKYHEELEYLYIYQLGYRMSLMLLPNHKTDEMKHCMEMIHLRMPSWKKNRYYQKKPLSFRLYCRALEAHLFRLCLFLQKVR